MRRADLIAGVSVAGLLLPEAVAYSAIAGLPAGRAVIAGIAGSLIYAAVGRSRFAIISPTSSAAAILAATLAAMPVTLGDKAVLATAAVLLTGAMFAIAALLRLGGLTQLIARPVLRGFAFGIALTIILKQLPVIAGVAVAGTNPLIQLWALIGAHAQWNLTDLAMGGLALLAYLALRQRPMLPGALIILACGVLASALLDPGARGVALVGPISGLSSLPGLPILPAGSWSRLAPYILPLMLILFAESWGTISALGLRHGDSPRANRELLALGLSNLGAGLLHGMPVGAGFSAGAANEGAGAQSRWACVIAAAGLAGLVTLAAPLVAALPLPVLAAVVIGTLLHGLNPAPFLKLRHQRMDLALALIAAFGVLIFGVLNGMLLAVALSIAALIRRMAAPRLDRLGQLGAGHDYVDLARHAEAVSPNGITIWRPAAPLFFANAEPVLTEILRATETPGLILSLEESADLDSSALEALQDFAARAEQQGIALQLARVHDHLRDRLRDAGAAALLDRASYSTADAVRALQAHLPANRAAPGSITQA